MENLLSSVAWSLPANKPLEAEGLDILSGSNWMTITTTGRVELDRKEIEELVGILTYVLERWRGC